MTLRPAVLKAILFAYTPGFAEQFRIQQIKLLEKRLIQIETDISNLSSEKIKVRKHLDSLKEKQ